MRRARACISCSGAHCPGLQLLTLPLQGVFLAFAPIQRVLQLDKVMLHFFECIILALACDSALDQVGFMVSLDMV